MGPNYAFFGFGVIAGVLWFFMAICSCKLYNLYAPSASDNVTGVQVRLMKINRLFRGVN